MLKRTLITVLVLVAACGEDSFPPEACGTIDDMEILLDDEVSPTPVELCFQDPEGDEITATATSSDPGVVEAVVLGGAQAVQLTPIDVGRAVIEVVATDATGGSSAPLSFAVTVPNRAPEARDGGDWPPITLTSGQPQASLTLTEYFRDPDGHRLAFWAVMSDESVARASVSDSILQIEQLQGGSAVVRVTATDPHGLSTSGQAEVISRMSVELLIDQFATLSERWEVGSHSLVEIVGGRLKLQSTRVSPELAFIRQAVSPAEDWSVTLNTEYVSAGDDMYAGFVIDTGSFPEALMFVFGGDQRKLLQNDEFPRTNFFFAWFDNGWRTDPSLNAWVDEITNTKQTYTVRVEGHLVEVLVNDAVIHELALDMIDFYEPMPGTVVRISLLALWPITQDLQALRTTEATYFDWVKVDGTPIHMGAAEAASAVQWERFLHPFGIRRIVR